MYAVNELRVFFRFFPEQTAFSFNHSPNWHVFKTQNKMIRIISRFLLLLFYLQINNFVMYGNYSQEKGFILTQ